MGVKGHDLSQVLHALQELATVLVTGRLKVAVMVTGRLGVAEGLKAAVVVVVVVVVFVIGHVKVDIAALEGMKHAMSNFLDLLLFWDLFEFVLLLFVGVVLLQKVVWTQAGVNGLISPLCSSIYALIFFWSEGKGCTCFLQGLQVVDWAV